MCGMLEIKIYICLYINGNAIFLSQIKQKVSFIRDDTQNLDTGLTYL